MSNSSHTNVESIRHRVWIGEETTKAGKKKRCIGGLFFTYPIKSWSNFKKYIDDAIEAKNGNLQKVRQLAHHSQWRKIIVEGEGGGDIHWWQEFNLLLDDVEKKLKTSFTVSSETLAHLHEKIKSKIPAHKTKIKFGVFPNQDTILPFFFRHSYNRNLDVQFIKFDNWNDGLKAFKENKIDVALRDFATTVAFNSQMNNKHPLFFYPLFSFNGYFIFAKQAKLKEVARKYKATTKKFSQWTDEAKKELFESKSNKIILEKGTDFEWALLNFCKGFGCDINTVKANIIHWNTNDADTEFMKAKYVIHCTNPLNGLSFKGNKQVISIGHGESLNEHHNFNGILCTIDFLNKNEDAIAQLIATWFNDIVQLRTDLKKASSLTTEISELHLLTPLADFLNKEIPSTVKAIDLLTLLGEGHNIFYETPESAFNKFYKEILKDDCAMFQNYLEIALTQLGKDSDEGDEVLNKMNLIKNYMNSL